MVLPNLLSLRKLIPSVIINIVNFSSLSPKTPTSHTCVVCTSDNKEVLGCAVAADTMTYFWVVHRRLANAFKISICGINKLCALSSILTATHDIDGFTNLHKSPTEAKQLYIFDDMLFDNVCHGIECMHSNFWLSNTNEIGRLFQKGNDKTSLDTGNAYIVKVGAQSL